MSDKRTQLESIIVGKHTWLGLIHGQRGIGLAVEAPSFLFSVRFVQVDLVVADAVLARLVGEEAEASRTGPLLLLLLRRLRKGLLRRRRERALLAGGSGHGA